MKKQVTIIISLLFLFVASEAGLFAQKASTGTTMTEKEKEEMARKAEQMAKQAEKEKEKVEQLYKQNMIDAETRRAELADINEALSWEVLDRSNFTIAYPDGHLIYATGSQNSETLEFRKSVKESSFSREVPFELEAGTTRASISVSGACKEGEVRIKVLTPGGETYTEVLIDEYGSVNWNKSFTISEEDKGRTGKWKFVVNAKAATGNFRITIKSY